MGAIIHPSVHSSSAVPILCLLTTSGQSNVPSPSVKERNILAKKLVAEIVQKGRDQGERCRMVRVEEIGEKVIGIGVDESDQF